MNNKWIFIIVSLLVGCIFLYISYTAIPIGSDPGRVWRISKIFYDGDVAESFRSLEPFLTVSLYGTLFGISGIRFPLALVQGIANTLVLIIISNYLYKRYGVLEGIISLLLFSSSFLFWDRSVGLVPYPLFLLFITLGVLCFIKFREQNKNRLLFLSSVFFSYSIFTFNLALTSLSIIFLFCLTSALLNRGTWRNELKTVLKFYLYSLVLLAPWFYWRFTEAGMSFYQNPITWLIQKYWSKFNIILWNRPRPLTVEYFNFFLTTGIRNLIGPYILLLFSIFGLIRSRQLIFLFWALSPIYPILVGKLPIEERYLYAMLPPLIILISIGIPYSVRRMSQTTRYIVLSSLAAITLTGAINNYRQFIKVQVNNQKLNEEIISIGRYLEPGQNLYARSYQYQPLLPDNLMMSVTHFTEEDAVDFIAWNTDSEVKAVMNKYDLKWVILYSSPKLEHRFNAWISLINPQWEPKHYLNINSSPLFTKRTTTDNFILYEYNE
jgi:hypothetical protein